jgi:aerobic-type carbon monoxide dehydrogenase small subunit (CoxS/CutS family)
MSLEFKGPDVVPLTLNVNGKDYPLNVEPRRTLLSVLREELGLTGSKRGCGRGECGACTVIIDGETAYACLTLAVACQGRAIRTIESLAQGGKLHPVQEAFIEHDAYQCGFCTPGQVMSAVALLEHTSEPDESVVRHEMAGNLCRCGAYPNIVKAVLAAAAKEA